MKMKKLSSDDSSEKNLLILHISSWYPSKKKPVEGIFVREHVKAAAIYNDVIVICAEEVEDGERSLCTLEESIDDGIRTICLRYKKLAIPGANILRLNYLCFLICVVKAFQKLLSKGVKPDIIHAHIYSSGVPAVLLGKLYKIPVIVTEHYSAFPLKQIRGFEKIKACIAFKWANLVCPVSENLKKHIEKYGIKTRFHIVPNAVDTTIFSPPKRMTPSERKKKRLLLVAMLRPIKGIPNLLHALAILLKRRNDFELIIVGDGPYREEYEKLVAKLGLEGVVSFHGLKTKKEVSEYMKDADIFVLPSVWENLPCVIIEALASGLPVVATNVGGIPELVNDENGVLVPPEDLYSLANALDYALNKKWNRCRIAEKAVKQYSIETIGHIWTRIYHDLIFKKNKSCHTL